jgi:hypothetical protein
MKIIIKRKDRMFPLLRYIVLDTKSLLPEENLKLEKLVEESNIFNLNDSFSREGLRIIIHIILLLKKKMVLRIRCDYHA